MNDKRPTSFIAKRFGFGFGCFLVLFMLGMLGATLVGCNSQTAKKNTAAAGKSNRVVAVCYALQYLTERIAGDTVEVEFPVPAAVDPKSWKPSVAEIQSLQSADLVVSNGAKAVYAKWLERITLEGSKRCESTADFAAEDYLLVRDHKVVHSHGPEGEHSHAFSVPYCWLDPSLAKKQADAIAKSLTATYPEHSKTFAANLTELKADLDKLVAEFAAAEVPYQSLFSMNPLTRCFTQAIGAEDQYLFLFEAENREDLTKSTEKLAALSANPTPDGSGAGTSQCILVSPVAEKEFADFLQELPAGMKTISINMLDHAPATGDYLSAMRQNLKAIGTPAP